MVERLGVLVCPKRRGWGSLQDLSMVSCASVSSAHAEPERSIENIKLRAPSHGQQGVEGGNFPRGIKAQQIAHIVFGEAAHVVPGKRVADLGYPVLISVIPQSRGASGPGGEASPYQAILLGPSSTFGANCLSFTRSCPMEEMA